MTDNELRQLCESHGLLLVRHTGQHYQIRERSHRFTVDLWPAKQKLAMSGAWPGPRFYWEKDWGLEEAVRAVIEKLQTAEQHHA